MDAIDFKNWTFRQHDVVCNQKYGDGLPYSFHLQATLAQAYRFRLLWPQEYTLEQISSTCVGHDLLEDARVSYNDLRKLTDEVVANAIFALTELRGKTREERHNDEYFGQIKVNELARFVKLCDLAANVLYSKLTNSSMLNVYQRELPEVWRRLREGQDDKLGPIFTSIEEILLA